MYTELGSLYPPAKSSRQGSTHRQEPVHPLCVPKIPCQSTLEYSFPAVLVLGDRQDGSMAALNFEIYLASPTDSATAADKQSTSTSADCLSTLVSHRRCRAGSVSYTHLRAHETVLDLVCRLLLEKKKNTK
eukprot:TRINITY_DN6609_c0_g1_i7.p1 TRINITY_DN6609_c0_g1~~TRINITY_DN6609_c0_g1_i7.p1  ORF type:complete len:131 (+),score=7.16 TRINITY_DN6609_c0_g1_i7:501-893(+)